MQFLPDLHVVGKNNDARVHMELAMYARNNPDIITVNDGLFIVLDPLEITHKGSASAEDNP